MNGRHSMVAAILLIPFFFLVKSAPLLGGYGENEQESFPLEWLPCSTHEFPSGLRLETILKLENIPSNKSPSQFGESKFVKGGKFGYNNCLLVNSPKVITLYPMEVKNAEPAGFLEVKKNVSGVQKTIEGVQVKSIETKAKREVLVKGILSQDASELSRINTKVKSPTEKIPAKGRTGVKSVQVKREIIWTAQDLSQDATENKPIKPKNKPAGNKTFTTTQVNTVGDCKETTSIEDNQFGESAIVEIFKTMAEHILPNKNKLAEGASDYKPVVILSKVTNPFKGNQLVKTAALDNIIH